MKAVNRESVDQLIKHFWSQGYLTVSRKFGTYLPVPENVGKYEVDAIGRSNKKYAFGIILNSDDLNDPQLFAKLEYLASRKNRFSQINVTLFIGVSKTNINRLKVLLNSVNQEIRKNIRLFVLSEEASELNIQARPVERTLFA